MWMRTAIATGNPFASTLFGYADNINPFPSEPTALQVLPSVANRSAETGFYFQDDWKVTAELTLNLGLRYEWSTPYDERYNRIQFSNFTAPTGVNLDLTAAQSALASLRTQLSFLRAIDRHDGVSHFQHETCSGIP